MNVSSQNKYRHDTIIITPRVSQFGPFWLTSKLSQKSWIIEMQTISAIFTASRMKDNTCILKILS